MKSSTAHILSGLFLALGFTQAHAADQAQQPRLPQSYQVPEFTQSLPKAALGPVLGNDKDAAAAQPSARPADGIAEGTSVDWSAEVQTGVIYRGSRTK